MIRTTIIGAAGYAGAELASLLAQHDEADVAGLFGSDSRAASAAEPQRFSDAHPRFRGLIDLPIEPMSLDRVLALQPHAVFLATPHEVSHALVPALLAEGIVVFDLSAAYRLRNPSAYAQHYGFAHEYPHLLGEAVYGLPERFAAQISQARLIALPGCYPTSIVLPMAALVEAGAVDLEHAIIADCTSGVSGAGRAPVAKSMFCEVSYGPYGVLSHRHTPEISAYCGADVIFTPHLGPFERGIVSTIHARLVDGWNEDGVRAALGSEYAEEPFVRLLPSGAWPTAASVRGTNFCDVGLAVDVKRQHLILVSAIDNLLKGAAGQAVQCFNIRFDLPRTAGVFAGRKELSHV